MSAIQNIFKMAGPSYLARYGDRMPANHKKVMQAIMECRSGSYGTVQYSCEKCHATHELPTGFMKIRHFGFLNANSSVPLQKLRELIHLLHDVIARLISPSSGTDVPKKTKLVCGECGQLLRFSRFFPPGVVMGLPSG